MHALKWPINSTRTVQGEWDAFLQKEAPPEPLWVAWETALLVHGVRSGATWSDLIRLLQQQHGEKLWAQTTGAAMVLNHAYCALLIHMKNHLPVWMHVAGPARRAAA